MYNVRVLIILIISKILYFLIFQCWNFQTSITKIWFLMITKFNNDLFFINLKLNCSIVDYNNNVEKAVIYLELRQHTD